MTLSIHLPQPMEQALNSYCANHAISQDQAIAQALEHFLSAQDVNNHPPTPAMAREPILGVGG